MWEPSGNGLPLPGMPDRYASIIIGLARIIANACSVLLTETDCQSSYPLNSENASPLGTVTVYLSCAAIAMLTTIASSTAMNPKAEKYLLFSLHIFKIRNMLPPQSDAKKLRRRFCSAGKRAIRHTTHQSVI